LDEDPADPRAAPSSNPPSQAAFSEASGAVAVANRAKGGLRRLRRETRRSVSIRGEWVAKPVGQGTFFPLSSRPFAALVVVIAAFGGLWR
jgi:hypothetical protein